MLCMYVRVCVVHACRGCVVHVCGCVVHVCTCRCVLCMCVGV